MNTAKRGLVDKLLLTPQIEVSIPTFPPQSTYQQTVTVKLFVAEAFLVFFVVLWLATAKII